MGREVCEERWRKIGTEGGSDKAAERWEDRLENGLELVRTQILVDY